jgi:glycosyltransferase involved in cell wall biosynthesis
MKILIVIFPQVKMGSHTRSSRYAYHLSRHGHDVTLVVTSPKNRGKVAVTCREHEVVQVEMPDLLPGSLRSGWDPWNLLNRLYWLRDKKYDIVHAIESRPVVVYPSLYMQSKGIPLVMDWADWFGKGGSVEERPNPLVRTVLRPVETFYEEHFRTQADSATVICSLLRQKLIGLGMPEDKILYLPNGADLDRYKPLPVNVARSKTNIDPNIPIVGWIGAMFKKDAQLLVEAFNRLVEKVPNAHLLIAGYFNHDFKNLVSKPENLIFTGYLNDEDLNTYMSVCDLFWLPIVDSNANRGRFPFKLTHFMTMERPTITSPVGDIPDLFTGDEIGILTPDEPDGYVRHTIELLGQPERRRRMGINARKLAGDKFDWDTLTNNLEGFYERTINEHYGSGKEKRKS